VNLTELLKGVFWLWFRRRFPRLVRAGLLRVRDGVAAKSGRQAWTGVAMVAAGYLLKRIRRRTLLYAGPMSLGESMRVRVRRGDKVIDEFTVNG